MNTSHADTDSAFNMRGFGGAIAIAAALAACAPIYPAGPEQVHANNPSVTYSYSTDEELLLASQKAATFCSQYRTTAAKSGTIVSNSDGTNRVVFECVPVTPPHSVVAAVPPVQPMSYTYFSANELLRASDEAELTCMNRGMRSTATITTNADGSKTATFRCVP